MISVILHWMIVTLYFLGAMLTLPILYHILPKHESKGGIPLIMFITGLGIWAFTAGMQLAVPSELVKVYFLKLGGIGATVVPIAWFVFVLEYTQTDIPHKTKAYISLAVIGVIQNLFISTNELHWLYWQGGYSIEHLPFPLLVTTPNLLFFLFTGLFITLAGAGTIHFFWYAAKRGTTYQSHARLLGIGISFIITANLISIFGIGPYDGHLEVTPLGILVAEACLILALFKFDLLSLSPAERDQLLYEQEGIEKAKLLEETTSNLPTVNIGDIAERTRENFYETTDYDWDTISIRIDCNRTVSASEPLLERMFYVLYENAAEHNDSPVEIYISEIVFDDGFVIEDNGVGIPDSYKESVFDTGVSYSDGTGNGLAVLQHIVTGHGWEVSLSDSAEGGARFEITNISN